MIRGFDNIPFLLYKTNSRDDMFPQRSHSHKEVSLGYIETGETLIKVKGREFLLMTGDFVLIPADTIHICNPVDSDHYRYHMLYFDKRWFNSTFPSLQNGFDTLAVPSKEDGNKVISSLMNPDLSFDEAELLFITFFKSLLSRYCLDDFLSSQTEIVMERLHDKIVSMPQVSLHIDELADEASLNKFSFIRKYARLYGLTPHADIINRRIQRAILLFETSMDLTEIALECGFTDQSHFNKQFKLYSGLRPGEYRAALGNG